MTLRLPRRDALALGGAALLACACSAPSQAPPATRPPARPEELAVDPALPRPSGPALRNGRVVDVRAYGARGDGVTDDAAAVARAVDAAGPDPSTVLFPAGTYLLRLGTPIRPDPGVTLAGEPGRTVLRVAAAAPPAGDAGDAAVAVALGGADQTVDGLILERVADVDTVLLRVGRSDRLTVSRTMLVGHTEGLPTFCQGIQLGVDDDVSTALRLSDSVLSGLSYGLYQANESRAVTIGVDVDRCTFARNAGTDLEFNSPAGSFRTVRVRDCTFRDNDSPGFAVGLAYCADVSVARCSMTNYRMEAVHIEDYTADVTIEDNTLSACGLREFAHVQIISGASRITVRGNRHDALANIRPIAVVGALAGGSGSTAGGRPVVAPSAVTVTGNTMRCAAAVRAVSLDGVAGGSVTGNRVDGPGVAATSNLTPAQRAFVVRRCTDVTVANNVVAGVPV